MKRVAPSLGKLLVEAYKPRKVGDAVYSYRGRVPTTITKIDGAIVTLANGDTMHISHVRSVEAQS